MPQVKELLVEELQDLLHAETQLTNALPKMAEAANASKATCRSDRHVTRRSFRSGGGSASTAPAACSSRCSVLISARLSARRNDGLKAAGCRYGRSSVRPSAPSEPVAADTARSTPTTVAVVASMAARSAS